MKTKNFLISTIAVAAVVSGYWFVSGHRQKIAGKDPLSDKFEYWTIELSGTHRRCGGTYQDNYVANILFPKSLVSMIAKIPENGPVNTSGTAIYLGNEQVLQQTKRRHYTIAASANEGVKAQVTAIWSKAGTGTALEFDIKTPENLLKSVCLLNLRNTFEPVRELHLVTTRAESSQLSGYWTLGAEYKRNDISDINGEFKMTWMAGGTSGIPIPPPFNLKTMVRPDKTLLLTWVPMPLATKYDIYYSKGDHLSSGAELMHGTTESAWVVLELTPEYPFAIAVSATIDGIETQTSKMIVVSPEKKEARQ